MKTILLSIVCCCALCTGGCLSRKSAGVAAERGILQVEDRTFATRLDVVQDQTVLLDGGFLKAQVTLKNTGRRDATFQYRYLWKDRDGMTLKRAETLWTPLELHGREEAVVEGICPVPGSADFRLVIRPVKGH